MKKIIISAAAAVLLTGCAAMKEAAQSVDVSIDWGGVFEAMKAFAGSFQE